MVIKGQEENINQTASMTEKSIEYERKIQESIQRVRQQEIDGGSQPGTGNHQGSQLCEVEGEFESLLVL